MTGYKCNGAEVYQNGSRVAIKWYHHDVLPNQLFGRVNGLVFVAEPFINKTGFVPMFVRKKCINQNGTTSVKWMFEHPAEIVNAIKAAFMDKKIRLYSWKNHVDAITASKMAEDQQAKERTKQKENHEVRQLQKNTEAAGHKPARRTKAFRGKKNPSLSSDYVDLSRQNYGEAIDMGGRMQKMDASLASYMDGIH